MVYELAHQPVSDIATVKKYMDPEHRAILAAKQSKKKVKKLCDVVTKRLFNNAESPVPSDLPLFKAANQRVLLKRQKEKKKRSKTQTAYHTETYDSNTETRRIGSQASLLGTVR